MTGNSPGGESSGPGPMQAARRAARPVLSRRFYRSVSVGERDGYAVLLDGKAARTPAKRPLVVPERGIAESIAREWEAQASEIDPARMPMTRLVNLAIDRGTEEAAGLQDEVVRYAASDLVLYRASEPEGLVEVQKKHWDPVVDWAREVLGAKFVLAEGVSFVAQPEPVLAVMRVEVQDYPPPFALTALASITQITGSALIALMLARGKLAPVAAWNAAHVDEDWNTRAWGEDHEAAVQRAMRLAEFEAAVKMLSLARTEAS